ncbi:TetR/AcrR family transcriptional regulator [Dactylosporangium siamense]|uniref:TetR family transcriptional regulator n=1 Tax=Dactylosporangium siamense TaxID=685454 RepID=A0A919UCS6_9ACTN|nr:TetR/AcrR family transcriptional regulator [Dactylosporangium siamense]GIG47126.1 TetR family transcriptional regulator [Dactylosporangium siamense]
MTIEFLWAERPQPTRGPKPALTAQQVADTGVALARAEGLAALSMQRIAAELGFTKMSLYRYVPGKAELVALMVERAIGAPPAVPGTDWRAGLSAWASAMLERFVTHPWALEATLGPRPIGPNELAWMEAALSVLADSGLTAAERLDTVAVLAGHARMIAQQAAVARHGAAAPEGELLDAIGAVIGRHADRFPALAATLAEPAEGRNQAFTFGIDRILDGVGLLIAARRGDTPGAGGLP